MGQNTRNMSIKILAVSDQVVERIYSTQLARIYSDIDMIIGCGDLPYAYLEFILTVLGKPLFYVPGNHDPNFDPTNSKTRVPGGTNLDARTLPHNGLILAGLGGSVLYRPDGSNQYSQQAMYLRALSLAPQLAKNHLRYGRALDVLITHSPPAGIHDDDDPAHQGLRAINWLIKTFRPRYVLHGHTHFYRQNLAASRTEVDGTTVINVYPYRLIKIE